MMGLPLWVWAMILVSLAGGIAISIHHSLTWFVKQEGGFDD